MVLREAASQHTPALVVDGTCAAEVVVDMKNGLTAPEDENKLSDKIISYKIHAGILPSLGGR